MAVLFSLVFGALMTVLGARLLQYGWGLFVALPLALMGGSIGYAIQHRPWHRPAAPVALLVLVAIVPALMEAESLAPAEPPLFAVRTAVDVNAPPEAGKTLNTKNTKENQGKSTKKTFFLVDFLALYFVPFVVR